MAHIRERISIIITGLFMLMTIQHTTMVHSMYYQNIRMVPAPSLEMMEVRSDPQNVYGQQQQQQQWGIRNLPYPIEQQQMQIAPMFASEASNNRMVYHQPNNNNGGGEDNLCQGGFVEYCLIQANQDGEQSMMMEIGTTGNRTDNNDKDKDQLSKEFDGMCQVVIRFINCINSHYFRCNPTSSQNPNTDVFLNSWTHMCGSDSKIRNKYLQHAKCIKHALSHNNGQEQCQSLFQSYFLSSQFALDSMENTVQYGCCAFNEWQYCIDSLIQRQCGPDATKAIQDLINQASAGLVTSLCEKKIFGRKSKACSGKKNYNYNKLSTLDPMMNATLQKYVTIFGEFIERLPDDDDDDGDVVDGNGNNNQNQN
ncbi:hypothetical protein DERF_008026 [Dermatophagoides farinae]|uniref:DUF19 domain-containing protein n=1 Tax=Dermatophagoides farinae TaxID=6954 RepID=A0A922L8Q7_DERFA|nr:hypothetical protein DERF_008026 [Dermatophagoides farinae]